MATVTVHRKRGPAWVFTAADWDAPFEYHTKKNRYRLFLERDGFFPVWIGLLSKTADGKGCWVTAEAYIRATRVEFPCGVYTFKEAR